MARRQTAGLLLVLALFLAPLRASTPSCAMGQPVVGMSCSDCCATMKSCILPRQNPTNSLTPAPTNPLVFSMVAPLATVLLHQLFAEPVSYGVADVSRPFSRHSRHAVFCTFLI